jgi:hypothetical protein
MQDNQGKTTSISYVDGGPGGERLSARHVKRTLRARYMPAVLISMIVVPMLVILGFFAAVPVKGAGPLAPTLGTAQNYAVLAGTTITNVGSTTSITGSIGVAPGTAITGITTGMVTGTIDKHNNSANASQIALTAAYNQAADLATGQNVVTGDIGSTTPLAPGLYNSTTSIEITAENLTLNGLATDVWVFQMASTLTVASNRAVHLTGGAVAANVFWQVGSSATLGTYSSFNGTIMAKTSITLDTGAKLNGRALAENGAVTLDTNIIINPSGTVIPEFSQVLIPLVGMMFVVGIVSKVRNQKK